jgi:hypothetical protein
MTKNLKIFFEPKLQVTYLWASMKDAQGTGDASSIQKRTVSNSKNKISSLVLFCGIFFALPFPM